MILGSPVPQESKASERIGKRCLFVGCALVIRAKFLNARVDRGLRTLYQFRQP